MMKHKAVLLDLGGVVLDIDVGRVFEHWAAAGSVSAESLIKRWQLDAAYEYVNQHIGIDPADILFLDDNSDRALEAGLDAKLVRSKEQVADALRTALAS